MVLRKKLHKERPTGTEQVTGRASWVGRGSRNSLSGLRPLWGTLVYVTVTYAPNPTGGGARLSPSGRPRWGT